MPGFSGGTGLIGPEPPWKNFVTDFGAPTNGTSDSTAAATAWMAYAVAHDGSKLYIPPGNYVLPAGGLTTGINNVTISGYGASVSNLFIGSPGLLRQDTTHSSRFQTTSIGATSLTLVTGAEISRFSVGQWILVSGLGLQASGYPPNFQYNEFRQISQIVSSTISFITPLNFAYLSTWPLVDPAVASGYDMGGPATVYAMDAAFAGAKRFLGLRVTQAIQVSTSGGESMYLQDMAFNGPGPAPSMAKSFVIKNTAIGSDNEIDKSVEYLEYNNCHGPMMTVQSASITNLVLKAGSSITTMNGTAQNTTIDSSTVGEVVAGPVSYGHGFALTAINSTISTTRYAARAVIDASVVTFSSGTFSVLVANREFLINVAVPGQKYFFAYYDGSVHSHADGTGLVTSFTITAVRQDATNTYIDTDLGGTLPTPTYGGNAANRYLAYAAATVTQTSSGPADLTQWAAPP